MTVVSNPLDPLHTLTLSHKQFVSIKESDARYNIWVGAVRSGKSFSSLWRWIEFIAEAPAGELAIIGKSRDTIKRNVLGPLKDMLGDKFQYYLGKGEAYLFNRLIHIIGANDERAENKIRGCTLAGAYVDEITIIPETVFQMLKSRLSVKGAKLFGTTNPDSPFHWFKASFLDRKELNIKSWDFKLDDNPSLDEAFKNDISKEYTGLWKERYIEGKWVLAEGTVFDFFDKQIHTIPCAPGLADYYVVGVDYGTTNPCAFALIGYSKKTYPNKWLEKEYYWDSKKQLRQKTDTEYAQDLKRFIEGYNVKQIYIDPSAVSFRIELQRMGFHNLIEAENEVLDGIRYHALQLSNGTFKICGSCQNTIQEYGTYRWDERASTHGVDKPMKSNDHILDAIRYVLYTHFFKRDSDGMTPADLDRLRNEAYGNTTHGKFFDDRMW